MPVDSAGLRYDGYSGGDIQSLPRAGGGSYEHSNKLNLSLEESLPYSTYPQSLLRLTSSLFTPIASPGYMTEK